MPQPYRTEGNLTKQYKRAKILGISFGRVGHEPVAMKANLLAVIPFEVGGATILGISARCQPRTNMEAAESPAASISLEGRETSIVSRGGADY
jgi:hypothetical protein